MNVYKPLRGWSEPASIPQIVAHIQNWLEEHPYIDPATVAELVKEALENNPDVINGDTIPIDETGTPSIKAFIDGIYDILTLAINAKADADNVYTKTEIDYQMGQKANSDNVYTKSESNALLSEKADKTSTYTKTETDALLADKAEKSTTYTKTETDNLLADKADKTETYTKTETNNLLNNKADKSTTYTKAETDNFLANKADKATTYTKTEIDDFINPLNDSVNALNVKTSSYYAPNDIESGTDLNNLKTPGRYALRNSNISNAPATGIFGYLDVVSYGGGYTGQIIYSFTGISASIYMRRCTFDNLWGSWITFTA